jgi:integrase
VKLLPVLRELLTEMRAGDPDLDGYMFATSNGGPMTPPNVRNRILARAVELANERLADRGEAPLPRLSPHALRRIFASVLYAIGEQPPAVMADMGHTDPALALEVYAHAMRRDEGETDRLRALVEGADFGSKGSGTGAEVAAEAVDWER